MLKHKKNVDLKNVCDIKRCICYKHLLTIHNTKKYVCLKDNKSWLENAKEEKKC